MTRKKRSSNIKPAFVEAITILQQRKRGKKADFSYDGSTPPRRSARRYGGHDDTDEEDFDDRRDASQRSRSRPVNSSVSEISPGRTKSTDSSTQIPDSQNAQDRLQPSWQELRDQAAGRQDGLGQNVPRQSVHQASSSGNPPFWDRRSLSPSPRAASPSKQSASNQRWEKVLSRFRLTDEANQEIAGGGRGKEVGNAGRIQGVRGAGSGRRDGRRDGKALSLKQGPPTAASFGSPSDHGTETAWHRPGFKAGKDGFKTRDERSTSPSMRGREKEKGWDILRRQISPHRDWSPEAVHFDRSPGTGERRGGANSRTPPRTHSPFREEMGNSIVSEQGVGVWGESDPARGRGRARERGASREGMLSPVAVHFDQVLAEVGEESVGTWQRESEQGAAVDLPRSQHASPPPSHRGDAWVEEEARRATPFRSPRKKKAPLVDGRWLRLADGVQRPALDPSPNASPEKSLDRAPRASPDKAVGPDAARQTKLEKQGDAPKTRQAVKQDPEAKSRGQRLREERVRSPETKGVRSPESKGGRSPGSENRAETSSSEDEERPQDVRSRYQTRRAAAGRKSPGSGVCGRQVDGREAQGRGKDRDVLEGGRKESDSESESNSDTDTGTDSSSALSLQRRLRKGQKASWVEERLMPTTTEDAWTEEEDELTSEDGEERTAGGGAERGPR